MADSISAASSGPDPYSARVQRTTAAPAASTLGTLPGSLASNVQLQQALQQRKVTSELLSTLMTSDGRFLRPPQAERPARAEASLQAAGSASQKPSWNWQAKQAAPAAGSDAMAAIRSAEDIIQAASAGPPSAEGRRIAAEAFLMEAQAQREFEVQQQGTAARREWMA
jgi:hypothetical protein